MQFPPPPKNIWLRLLYAPVAGGFFVLLLPALGFGLLAVEVWRWAKGKMVEAGPSQTARVEGP